MAPNDSAPPLTETSDSAERVRALLSEDWAATILGLGLLLLILGGLITKAMVP